MPIARLEGMSGDGVVVYIVGVRRLVEVEEVRSKAVVFGDCGAGGELSITTAFLQYSNGVMILRLGNTSVYKMNKTK